MLSTKNNYCIIYKMTTNKKYGQSLIVGRFQPFCLNHVDLFTQSYELSEKLLIAIGRPNYEIASTKLNERELLEYKIKNIFSFERTTELLKTLMSNYFKNNQYDFVSVKDIFDSNNYANHVINSFKSKNTQIQNCVLIGENEWTINCFANKIDFVKAKNNLSYHATDVRRDLINGNLNGLAVKLTDVEISRVITCQKLLDYKGDLKKALYNSNYEILN